MLQAIREVSPRCTTIGRWPARWTTTFDHAAVALSAGGSRWSVRTSGASGVRFTMDTEKGFDDTVCVTT